MKNYFLFYSLLFSSLNINFANESCGYSPALETNFDDHRIFKRLIGGQEAKLYHWPWVASIVFLTESRDWETLCTAVILDQNWVLTSASCYIRPLISFPFVNITKNGFISVGITDVRDASALKRYQIEQVVIPDEIQTLLDKGILTSENYFGYLEGYDIGLIKVSRPFEFDHAVSRICLASELETKPKKAMIAGWGHRFKYFFNNRMFSEPSRVLRISNVTIKNFNKDEITVGGPGEGVLDGDLGGPLMVVQNIPEPRFVLVGIASTKTVDRGKFAETPVGRVTYTVVQQWCLWFQEKTENEITCF